MALFNLVPNADLTIGSRDHQRERRSEGVRWKRAGNATTLPSLPVLPCRLSRYDARVFLFSRRFMEASLSAIGTYRPYEGLVSLPSFARLPPSPSDLFRFYLHLRILRVSVMRSDRHVPGHDNELSQLQIARGATEMILCAEFVFDEERRITEGAAQRVAGGK